MSRRKKETDVHTNGTADQSATAVSDPPSEVPAPPADTRPTEKRGPLVSYRLNSDRTTSIQASVWANTYTNQKGEEYEQLTVSIQRSYLDNQGQWTHTDKPFWRVHDIPVLMFLLTKVHGYAMDRRCEDSSIPF